MPQIEEIDENDIDNHHFSIDDFDSHNPFSKDTPVDPGAPVQLKPTNVKPPAASSSSVSSRTNRPSPADVSGLFGSNTEAVPTSSSRTFKANHGKDLPEHMKSWKVIYPVYFDKNKTVRQGRQVPIEFAVENPLAVTLCEAFKSLGYDAALELTKSHPKDWANPGRVRINIPAGKCKREFYGQVSKFLKGFPVTAASAREDLYRQVAQFDSLRPLAVPRNMTMPKILPGVSPALSAKNVIDESMKMGGNEMAKMMGMA